MPGAVVVQVVQVPEHPLKGSNRYQAPILGRIFGAKGSNFLKNSNSGVSWDPGACFSGNDYKWLKKIKRPVNK